MFLNTPGISVLKINLVAVALSTLLVSGSALAQKVPGDGVFATSAAARAPGNPNGTPTLTVSVPIGGTTTFAACDFAAPNPANTTIAVDLGPNAVVTGFGGTGTLETIGGSWASEAGLQFFGSNPEETVRLRFLSAQGSSTPAGGSPFNVDPPLDLSDNNLPNIQLGADGILTVEFCETYVDNAGSGDANFLEPSTLTIQCYDCTAPGGGGGPGGGDPIASVPLPSTNLWGLLALALGLGFVGHRAMRRTS